MVQGKTTLTTTDKHGLVEGVPDHGRRLELNEL